MDAWHRLLVARLALAMGPATDIRLGAETHKDLVEIHQSRMKGRRDGVVIVGLRVKSLPSRGVQVSLAGHLALAPGDFTLNGPVERVDLLRPDWRGHDEFRDRLPVQLQVKVSHLLAEDIRTQQAYRGLGWAGERRIKVKDKGQGARLPQPIDERSAPEPKTAGAGVQEGEA